MVRRSKAQWSAAAGDVCFDCGLEPEVATVMARSARARAWLRDGHPPGNTYRCANGHEWTEGSRSMLSLSRRSGWSRSRIWTAPARALRVLMQHRVVEPVPVIWLIVSVIGVALGGIAHLVLGWWWWLVALSVFGLIWLTYAASAFTPMGREDLGRDLAAIVSPRRAEAMDRRQLSGSIAALEWPIFGLTSAWTGIRLLGGHSRSSQRGLGSITLLHGEPSGRRSVEVRTVGLASQQSWTSSQAREELTHEMWTRQEEAPEGLVQPDRFRWLMERRHEISQRPIPPWDHVTVLVDGAPRVFDLVQAGQDWVALAELKGVAVEIRSRAVPLEDVALTRVTDLDPYFEGHDEVTRRRANNHD